MIRFPSALDVTEKDVPKNSAAPKKEADGLPKKEALPKISAAPKEKPAEKLSSDIDSIVDNTVELFHAYAKKKRI